jgi:hypothetical protein
MRGTSLALCLYCYLGTSWTRTNPSKIPIYIKINYKYIKVVLNYYKIKQNESTDCPLDGLIIGVGRQFLEILSKNYELDTVTQDLKVLVIFPLFLILNDQELSVRLV